MPQGSAVDVPDRFQQLEALGHGGFGSVYRALDRRTNAVVAMKRLSVRDPVALASFKNEFRSLAGVVHPNLVSLFELHSDGSNWFYTMEYVDGAGLLSHLRGGAPPPVGPAWEDATAATPAVEAQNTAAPGANGPHTRLCVVRSGDLSAVPLASVEDLNTLAVGEGDLDATVGPEMARLLAARRLPSRGACMVRDFDEARRVLGELADGLAWLHSSGKLHRDVKPQNVIVERSGRVVVLDFGLVSELADRLIPIEGVGMVVGTPSYIAPEVAIGGTATPASDWYSFGVLLYQVLTGDPPFCGELSTVLRAKVYVDPLPPVEVAQGVPDDLNELCRMLLDRRPGKRPGIDRIRSLLGVTQVPQPRRAASAPFVGRRRELVALRGALESAQAGVPTVALVHGMSGMGKSLLVDRFLESVAGRSGAWALSGRCYEQESVPYKALDGVVDVLMRRLASLDAEEQRAITPPGAGALARLFPVFRRLEPFRDQDTSKSPTDVRQLLRTAQDALRELIEAVCARATVVMIIDDLQWGDEDSVSLLAELLRPPHAARLLLVCAYRRDEAESSPFLRRLLAPGGPIALAGRVVDVPVDALPIEDAEALVRTLGGSEEQVGALVEEAGGSPLFLDELVRHQGPEGGHSPGATMDGVIRARVAALPEPARRILEVVSLAGRPIALEMARVAAGLESVDPKHTQLLISEHLARFVALQGQDRLAWWHDRTRETVIGGLDAGARRTHHRGLAQAAESGGGDHELIAEHWLGAGERAKALPHAVAAAERARTALAFDRAARFYRMVIDLSPAPDPEVRVHLAESLRSAGRGADAAVAFLEAAEHVPSDRALALRVQATEQYLFTGEYAAGEAIIRDVLARVGLAPARSVLTSMAGFGRWSWALKRRGLDFTEREPVDPETLTQLDILWSASIGMSMASPLESQAIQKRHLLLALNAGDPARATRALCVELAFSGLAGGRDERTSQDLSARAHALAERVGLPHGRALAAMSDGATHWLRGRWSQARDAMNEALATYRAACTGVTWECDTAQFVALDADAHLGRWASLREQVPRLLADAVDRGDRYIETQLRTRFSWLLGLCADEPARAREDLAADIGRWTAKGFHIVHFWEMTGQAWVALYEGRGEEALEELRRRERALWGSMMLAGQYYRGLYLDLRARALLAGAVESGVGSRAGHRHLRWAARLGRRLVREDMPWTIPLGQSVLACIAACEGEHVQATSGFAAAEVGFRAVGMDIQAAAARARRGLLLELAGDLLVAEGHEALAAQGVARPERMVAALAPLAAP